PVPRGADEGGGEKHAVGRSGIAGEEGPAAGADQAHVGPGAERGDVVLEIAKGSRMVLDQDDPRRAARESLEAAGAAAGEKVEAAGAAYDRRKPVEQRFAHPVRRRPKALHALEANAPAAQRPADDAQRAAP